MIYIIFLVIISLVVIVNKLNVVVWACVGPISDKYNYVTRDDISIFVEHSFESILF